LPQALALTAAVVSTVVLLIVASLTAFLVSLAFRAKRTPCSRWATRDPEMSTVGELRANRPKTERAPAGARISPRATDFLDDGSA
jgi:hypothetical protein